MNKRKAKKMRKKQAAEQKFWDCFWSSDLKFCLLDEALRRGEITEARWWELNKRIIDKWANEYTEEDKLFIEYLKRLQNES